MKMQEIREKVIGLIEKYTQVKREEIKDNSNIRSELYFNSIEFINFIVDIESLFKVEVDDEDIRNIYTVTDVVEYIVSKSDSESTVKKVSG